jgi:hypothetical protein
MPIHKQLRKRAVASSEDIVSEDVAGVKPNAPQQQQQQPAEATSVISDDSDRKPAHTIGTKVKKVRASFFSLVVVFMHV